MKDPSVVEPILSFARTPQGAWINQEQVLLAFRDGRLVQALLDHLKDRDEATRAAAARDLTQYRDERIMPALIAALKDEAWTVQYAAAASLGNLGDPHATSALVAMLDYNPGAAALALGDLHRVETVTQLSALLASPKASNRKEIVAGIAKMPEPVAARAFASFIEKNPVRDCDLDNAVAQALAKLNDPGVIPTLQKINLDGWKKDGCVLARVTAAAALSQRGARAFPEGKENSVVP
jgi:HEAT repeat protein